jgi:hypothetical protein
MQSQFDVTSCPPATPPTPADPSPGVMELLRQILEVQREQLVHMQTTARDASARWRALMARWREEFPGLSQVCREVLPTLERAHGSIISNLAEELREKGSDALDSEFALQDFLDRYGLRLGQIGNILNLVTPLAEAGSQNESS